MKSTFALEDQAGLLMASMFLQMNDATMQMGQEDRLIVV